MTEYLVSVNGDIEYVNTRKGVARKYMYSRVRDIQRTYNDIGRVFVEGLGGDDIRISLQKYNVLPIIETSLFHLLIQDTQTENTILTDIPTPEILHKLVGSTYAEAFAEFYDTQSETEDVATPNDSDEEDAAQEDAAPSETSYEASPPSDSDGDIFTSDYLDEDDE